MPELNPFKVSPQFISYLGRTDDAQHTAGMILLHPASKLLLPSPRLSPGHRLGVV